jgi:hypothetical protein
MARADELGYDGGADPAGRAGDENAHEKTSRWSSVLGTDVRGTYIRESLDELKAVTAGK